MKTALILGITGNFGKEMATALNSRGWKIKSIVRDRRKLTKSQLDFDITEGSFLDRKTLYDASADVDLIVYAISPAYTQWHKYALAMLEPVVKLAEERQLQLLFPGNVYNLSPDLTAIDESTHSEPLTTKGKIRAEMESRLLEASKSGARVTIIRAGDFIGQDAQWLNIMLKNKRNRFTMSFPHSPEHRHFWSYLPDLCANAAEIVERENQPFEIWHDPGYVLTQDDWQQAFRLNGHSLRVAQFPWWLFTPLAYFVPLIRELMEMKYLWEKTLILNGNKLRMELGARYQQTSLESIIKKLTA